MAQERKHLYLPQLSADANIKEPATAAHWEKYDPKILLGVSEGILVDDRAKTRGVSSVPDAWARPLTFQAALRPGSRHPLRERTVREWRGLLSLLALRQLHNDPVSVVPVSLEGDGTFDAALRRLAPSPVQLEKGRAYRWTDVLLIRYDNIPLGAFSPTTLVYTATSYHRQLRGIGLNLADDEGYLRPPTEPEEIEYVGEWVDNLIEQLNAPRDGDERILDTAGNDNPDRERITDINALLREWRDETRGTSNRKGSERIDAADVEVEAQMLGAPDVVFLENYRVYQQLLRPLRLAAESGTHSDIALKINPERNYSGYKEVVVITPKTLQSNGKVWRSKRLAHLGGDVRTALKEYFDKPFGHEIGTEDLKKSEAIWIRPELYFLSDTLVVAPESAPFLADGELELNPDRRFVLPFRREILNFFSPEEIRDVLKPTYRETDTGIAFSFRLPVGARGEHVDIERTYRLKNATGSDGVISSLAVPAIDVFPNYLDANWRRYYVFQGAAESITTSPVVFGETTVVNRVHSRLGGREQVRVFELSGDAACPEAGEIAVGGGPPRPVGLILLGRPAQSLGLTGQWRVGVDFGTSNTNVFRQRSTADNPERWQFTLSRYTRSITAAPHADRRRLREAFFLPDRDVDLPFPTTLRIYQDAQTDHLFLDYSLYFTAEYRLPPNVYSNLKWDEESGRKTKLFFGGLLFLILMEAIADRVKSIELVFSYPKAFSPHSRDLFERDWKDVLETLLEGPNRIMDSRRSGSKGIDVEKLSSLSYQVEGIAAGQFFGSDRAVRADDLANIGVAALCLDVGGGTTDISIWTRKDIVLDASVLLAGAQISRLFQKRPRLLEVLFSQQAVDALAEVVNEAGPFAARLNVVLRQEERDIQTRLIDNAHNKDVQWLRRMLALEFGAITFYSAILLGAADRESGGYIGGRITESGIRLHWGGNAAKFLNWIDFGKYDRDGIAAKVLNAILYNALKDIGPVVPTAKLGHLQSPGHKSEAAGGLVVMDLAHWSNRQGAGNETESDDYPADGEQVAQTPVHRKQVGGENVQLRNRSVNYIDTLSEADLFEPNGSSSRTTFERTTLDRFTRFINMLNHFGIRYGLFTEDSKLDVDGYRTRIADRVESAFIEMESKGQGRRTVEPVFIMEVKELLKLLTDERP